MVGYFFLLIFVITKNTNMKFITTLFRISAKVHILITLIIFIGWLFDSNPTNLFTVWHYTATTVIILFLINLIFGKKFM